MANKTKLELTWIGKDQRPRLEPRILLEDPSKSYHATQRYGSDDQFGNKLIFGDNLLALKALEQEYAGRVKCVFIDPPYNTGSAFEQYDDGLEHSVWLSLMRSRIEILRNLLSIDGTLWISIDDREAHYLKVVCDEVFGRQNFVANAIWEKKFSPQNDAKWLSDNHDHVLVYARDKPSWRPNLLPRSEKQKKNEKNPDDDPRGPWISADYTCAKSKEERPNLNYPILNPHTNQEVWPNPRRVWAYDPEATKQNVDNNLLYWGKNGTNKVPRLKKFKDSIRQGTVPLTIWKHEDVGNNQEAKREVLAFNEIEPFATPKPERLLAHVITLATNPHDIILDSFAGSGTTGAVAQKMRRKWIMIELGGHCHTHILPRLKQVIDGSDNGGVSETFNWKGGGGFRYFTLAPSLLEKDKFGNWIISKEYNKEMLVEALCKLEGFQYEPSESVYWQHGHSTENDFIYVTTQTLTKEQIQKLSDEVGPSRSLLICCGAYRIRNLEEYEHLTLKKIPRTVMAKCEWGKDDYSLEIKNLAPAPEPELDPDEPEKPKPKRRRAKPVDSQMGLFEIGGEE